MIEAFIEDTNNANSSEEVYSLLLNVLNQFGYDRVVYSLITDHPTLSQKAHHGLVGNYPDEWMKYYLENKYQFKDPVPNHAFTAREPFLWDSLSKLKDLSNTEIQIMNEAKEAQLNVGIGIPIQSGTGEISGLGLASSTEKEQPDKNNLRKLQAICMQFHLAYSDHNSLSTKKEKQILTIREREILLWAAEGKSDPVIAEILGISHSTVRFHIKNIFRKLEVNERTLAVVKAIRMRMISPSFIGTPYQG